MSEFDIIADFFSKQDMRKDDVVLGIGDDAALVSTTQLNQIAIAIDTLISGVHFPEETSAYDIGWKTLAVNLSDMAAMGAEPLWFTLALSLPEQNKSWLSDFAAGLFELAEQYNVPLIGGDTTRGSMSITVQIAGKYTSEPHMQRRNAQIGDKIYITGTLGDAALGLQSLQQSVPVSLEEKQQLLLKLNRPQPRVQEALALRTFVNAAIDISDGLYADVSHITDASNVGAIIYVDKLPVSRTYRQTLQGENHFDLALTGGDDYELCLTISPENEAKFLAQAESVGCQVTAVGEIVEGRDLTLYTHGDVPYSVKLSAYDHFN